MATNEGTDQKSAERNLRLEYENLKKDEFVKKEYEPLPGKGKPEKMGESAKPLPGKGKTEKLGEGVKKYAHGGAVKSASSRADGIAQRGKTRGRIC